MNQFSKLEKLPGKQQGSALLICVILLVALTFTAVASLQSGVMQVRMSGALEDEMNAFQTAQAAIDFVAGDAANIPTTVALNTPVSVTLSGDAFTLQTGETIDATYTLTSTCTSLPRMVKGYSAGSFFGYKYRISANVDKRATRRGVSYQRQGLVKTVLSC